MADSFLWFWISESTHRTQSQTGLSLTYGILEFFATDERIGLRDGIANVSFLKQAMISNPVISFLNSSHSCVLTHHGSFDIFTAEFNRLIDDKDNSKTGVARPRATCGREVYS
jgi:hypothetical protein